MCIPTLQGAPSGIRPGGDAEQASGTRVATTVLPSLCAFTLWTLASCLHLGVGQD